MKKNDYLHYIIKEDILAEREAMFDFMVEHLETNNNKYVKLLDGKLLVKYEGEFIELEDGTNPIFNKDELYKIDGTVMSNIPSPIETTYGRIISNYYLTWIGLSGKVEFIDEAFTVGDLEDKMLGDFVNVSEGNETNFSPTDRDKLAKSISFIEDLANIIVVSKGRNTIHPHKGLEKFKKELKEKLKKKYGDALFTEETHFIEYNEAIKKFDQDNLSDDPSLGIVTSKKIIGKSRTKTYGAFGFNKNPFNPDTKGIMIEKPLNEGYELGEDKLPVYFNSARAGSLFRGIDTQESGSIAKTLITTALPLKYSTEDCGTKNYYTFMVKNGKKFRNRYILVKNREVLYKDLSEFNGKIVHMRDPMVCKALNGQTCKRCSGIDAAEKVNGAISQFTSIGGGILNSDMKKMHGSDDSNIIISFNP